MTHPPQPDDEITPEHIYLNRRNFIKAGILVGSAAATAGIFRWLNPRNLAPVNTQAIDDIVLAPEQSLPAAPASQSATQAAPATMQTPSQFRASDPQTPYDDITHYNNFYEFTTNKERVAALAANFQTKGWTVAVGGLCSKPKTFDLDDILKISAPEERVYRMRCVEGWSMVIPWVGYSLSKLLERVEPLGSAKYVAFETVVDYKQMPGLTAIGHIPFPYVEGLRMDEAMHPLTLLASGIYRRTLPGQNGAPVRIVIPWKYGFKGIKSIIKITLTDKEPSTTWSALAPEEYGFYANVNPEVPHPRWSQAKERRFAPGGVKIIDTVKFNGYGEQVAGLYAGMDLAKLY